MEFFGSAIDTLKVLVRLPQRPEWADGTGRRNCPRCTPDI